MNNDHKSEDAYKTIGEVTKELGLLDKKKWTSTNSYYQILGNAV